MYSKVFFLVFLFFSCNKKKLLDFSFPPAITQEEKQSIKSSYDFVYKQSFSLKGLKFLKNLNKNNYLLSTTPSLKRVRYLSSKDAIIFCSAKERKKLFIKNITLSKSKQLKKFKEEIYNFDINFEEDKIIIYFPYKYKLYTFPKFELLKEIKGNLANFDVNTGKLLYLKGGNLYSLSKDMQENVVYDGGLVVKYIILNNSDILIATRHQVNWFEIFFKGWKYKYKAFLLSNPKEVLKESGSYKYPFPLKKY